MKNKKLFTTLLALILFTVGHAQAIDKTKLDQYFDRLAEKNKAMGSLVITQNGKVLYSRIIGYSQINGTEKKPLTAASRYQIASITKTYTATMIMQLIEEKKLKLTDHLDQFFPQVPNASKITIEQILSHRSGIPNIKREEGVQSPATKEGILDLIAKSTPDFEPGAKHLYSNTGYLLLGYIVEKITGKPYAEALKQRITSKIGLKDTYVATGNTDVNKNEVLSYFRIGEEWKPSREIDPSILSGAGSIISTPDEMATFIQALFSGKFVSQQSLDQMKTMRDGDGFGMETFTFGGKTFYGHTGGGANNGAWLAYQPEEKVAIAYTTNAKVYPVANMLRDITDIYYNKPFTIPAFEAVAVSTELLDQYTGVYGNPEAPIKFTVTRQGNTLYVQPGKETAAPIEAIAPNRFQIEGAAIFEFDVEKKTMTIKRRQGERVFTKENQ